MFKFKTNVDFPGASVSGSVVATQAWVAAQGYGSGSGGGAAIIVADEGTTTNSNTTNFNFTGAGVTVTNPGSGSVTINIPSGSGGGGGTPLSTYEEGVLLTSSTSSINFVGKSVTATNTGGSVTVSIPFGLDPTDGALVVDFNGGQNLPAAATTRTGAFFQTRRAYRQFPAFSNTDVYLPLQTWLGDLAVNYIQPIAGVATISSVGYGITSTGTITAKNTTVPTNLASSSVMYAATPGVEFLVTVAASTAVAGLRTASAAGMQNLWRPGPIGIGGFMYSAKFSPATGTSASSRRFYSGLANATTAPTDVNPSTQTQHFGVGYDSTDANWQIMSASTGATTKIDTGIPKPAIDRASVFQLYVWAPTSASNAMFYEFWDQINGLTFSGSTTTALPTASLALGPRIYSSVGGVSAVTGFSLFGIYSEAILI